MKAYISVIFENPIEQETTDVGSFEITHSSGRSWILDVDRFWIGEHDHVLSLRATEDRDTFPEGDEYKYDLTLEDIATGELTHALVVYSEVGNMVKSIEYELEDAQGTIYSQKTTMITNNSLDPKGAAGARKTPLSLIPSSAMNEIALVHKFGADKYGVYNWRENGVSATTYVNAIMRHLNAWRDGEDLDEESGLSHIAHIACSCNILIDADHCMTLHDDRNKVI